MKKALKAGLLLLPVLYSLIRLKADTGFYIFFCAVYASFCLLSCFIRNADFFKYLVQIGISYIFLDISFHNVDFSLFFRSFRLIDMRIFLLVLVTTFLSLYIRAYKWKYLLQHIKPVRIKSLFNTIIVGFMVNSIFPARLGEVYRAYMLSRLEKISKSSIFATVVLERVFDGLVIGIGIVYIFLLNIIHHKIFYQAGLIGLGFYVAAILFLLVFYFRKNALVRIMKRLLFFIPGKIRARIFSLLDLFYEGLHIFKNIRNLLLFTIFTILTWAVIIFNMYLFLESMKIFQYIPISFNPLVFSILMTGLLAIGISIPSGPGAIGPFQASILFSFFLVNAHYVKTGTYEYNLIASFSMYCWISQVIIQIAAGLVVLAREKMTLKME
ncbi:MAG: lysylphosphatidylglycerol synthase transmembrane domain-containing protein [bacterium]|nr:lysylphosphatidylglycerol synthase transmembrane domain-containing protein [bacterium]